jgi:hypothetical protein
MEWKTLGLVCAPDGKTFTEYVLRSEAEEHLAVGMLLHLPTQAVADEHMACYLGGKLQGFCKHYQRMLSRDDYVTKAEADAAVEEADGLADEARESFRMERRERDRDLERLAAERERVKAIVREECESDTYEVEATMERILKRIEQA